MSLSVRDQIALLPDDEREAYLDGLDQEILTDIAEGAWWTIARPEQVAPPGDWGAWYIRAGRGGGKTRSGGEWSREQYDKISPQVDGFREALVAPTIADVRDTMIEGESGLLRILPPSMLRGGSVDGAWNRSLVEIHLEDGGVLKGYSSETPHKLRGPQFHAAWVDEPGYLADAHLGLKEDTTWSNLMLGLRLPPDPRVVVTGTPKNNALIKELIADPEVVVTQFSTYDNLHNLSEQFRRRVVERYEGSRLGRQELHADLLDSVGTMFQRGWFSLVDTPPPNVDTRIRYYDLAATEPHDGNNDPDWTAGARISMVKGSRIYCIEHMVRWRKSPGQRDNLIRDTAMEDGKPTNVWIEQEKAQAGKSTVSAISRHLDGVARVKGHPVSGVPKGKFTLGIEGKASEAKIMRAEILASAAEDGRVLIVKGDWVTAMLDEIEEFPNGSHFDQVDAIAGAFQVLTGKLSRPSSSFSAAGRSLPG